MDLDEDCKEPTIHNVVTTFDVECNLDLKRIQSKVRNCEYTPQRFSGAVCRITDPKSTALIFSSGKVVVTGARNREVAKRAARAFHKILKRVEPNIKLRNLRPGVSLKFQNIQASTDTGFPIRLETLATQEEHLDHISYEPELFPGLIYRFNKEPDPRVTVLVFVTGKIVFTGAKKWEYVLWADKRMRKILKKCRAFNKR